MKIYINLIIFFSMENDKNFLNRILSFLGYFIPFFGWMIPMYLKPKNEVLQHHARQSFILTTTLICNAVVYYLITRLIPIQYVVVEISLWLLILGIYVIMSLIFSFKALFGKSANMPIISRLSKNIPL